MLIYSQIWDIVNKSERRLTTCSLLGHFLQMHCMTHQNVYMTALFDNLSKYELYLSHKWLSQWSWRILNKIIAQVITDTLCLYPKMMNKIKNLPVVRYETVNKAIPCSV